MWQRTGHQSHATNIWIFRQRREELYQKVSPSGDPILINVEFFYINDKTPEDVEIRAVVKGMHNGTRT